jgi:hypothetical protein
VGQRGRGRGKSKLINCIGNFREATYLAAHTSSPGDDKEKDRQPRLHRVLASSTRARAPPPSYAIPPPTLRQPSAPADEPRTRTCARLRARKQIRRRARDGLPPPSLYRSVCALSGRLVGRLVGWFAGWWVGWWVGWWAGWWVGWWVGRVGGGGRAEANSAINWKRLNCQGGGGARVRARVCVSVRMYARARASKR